jgi:threonine/homoserine/homoserine lactone efflux protein
LDLGLLNLGFLLGLGAAAPLGPVNVEIARRTLRAGFPTGFALGCGAVSVDVLYAVLSSQGLKRLLDRPEVLTALGIGGVGMLLYLAVACFRGAWRAMRANPLAEGPPQDAAAAARRRPVRAAYVTGVLMTLPEPDDDRVLVRRGAGDRGANNRRTNP